MAIYQGRFLIAQGPDRDLWAEPGEGVVLLKEGKATRPEEGRVLLSLHPDQVLRLAAWAQPKMLLVPLTGLLARQVRDLAKEMALTPENFAVEALNAFIQAGEMASGGHAHGPGPGPAAQEITFEP